MYLHFLQMLLIAVYSGHVEVFIGRENLAFQGGPFAYYGLNALGKTIMGST